MRALGIQTIAAIVAICSFYLVSIPLASLLAFTHIVEPLSGTIKALWVGNYMGVFL